MDKERGSFKKVEIEHQHPASDQDSTKVEVSSIEEEVERSGFLDDITNLFTAPSALMESLAKKPRVLAPIIVILLLGVAAQLFAKQSYIDYMMEVFMERGIPNMQNANGPTADVNTIRQAIELNYIWVMIFGPVFSIGAALFFALIINGITQMMGGEGRYKQTLSVYLYAGIVMALGQFFVGIGKMLTGNYLFDLSLMMLKGKDAVASFYALLALGNPFVIWEWFLIALGLSKVHGLSMKKSSVLVVGTTVIINILFILGSLVLMKGRMG